MRRAKPVATARIDETHCLVRIEAMRLKKPSRKYGWMSNAMNEIQYIGRERNFIPIVTNNAIFELRESCRNSTISSDLIFLILGHLRSSNSGSFDALKYGVICYDWYNSSDTPTILSKLNPKLM